VGDIIIQGERGAHVLVIDAIAEHIEQELKSVRSVPVEVIRIQLSELGVRPPVKKEVREGKWGGRDVAKSIGVNNVMRRLLIEKHPE